MTCKSMFEVKLKPLKVYHDNVYNLMFEFARYGKSFWSSDKNEVYEVNEKLLLIAKWSFLNGSKMKFFNQVFFVEVHLIIIWYCDYSVSSKLWQYLWSKLFIMLIILCFMSIILCFMSIILCLNLQEVCFIII